MKTNLNKQASEVDMVGLCISGSTKPVPTSFSIPVLVPVLSEKEKQMVGALIKAAREEVKYHAVPLTILAAIVLCPLILILWVPFVLLWSAVEAIYGWSSPARKEQLKRLLPERWTQPNFVQEMSDGMSMVRPYILASIYFACIPVAIIWMSAHWCCRLLGSNGSVKRLMNRYHACSTVASTESFSFVQNRRKTEEEEECNFIHSPAFSLTCAAVFASGIPAAVTYAIYNWLGVDTLFGNPSLNPQFSKVFLLGGLYFYGIGSCASILFIKNWFTFPLHFVGDEQKIEMTENGITCKATTWFSQVLTCNMPWAGAASLHWAEVKALRLDRSMAPLYPLPTNAFASNSLIYNCLNRIAQLIDGVSRSNGQEEFLYLTTSEFTLLNSERINSGRLMKISLSDLDAEQRARLYHCVRKWAPHVVIDSDVQEKVVGSTTLSAPRYTQLWFQLLTEKMLPKRAGMLPAGTLLSGGKIAVNERISSGGQANLYSATTIDGVEVVIKEFILSNSDAVGALLESASDFEAESTLLSGLNHPRIVKMLEFFAEDRRLYIVLERVKGCSLRQLVRESGTLCEEQVIEIARQISAVLGHLHSQEPPIVHRDISPDNVMFDPVEGVKVIDFSIATSSTLRHQSTTLGKHSYVPPEQLKEQPTTPSDIYALGATMAFLVTGCDPKPIMQSDLSSHAGQLSEKLVATIKHATALNLEDRYSEVEWLQLELDSMAACAESGS